MVLDIDRELEKMQQMTVAQLLQEHRAVFGEPSAARHRQHLVRHIAVLFARTFWSFPREFWTPGEQLRCGDFSVSFRQTVKHAIIGLCPQRLALNADTTIVFENLFKRLAT